MSEKGELHRAIMALELRHAELVGRSERMGGGRLALTGAGVVIGLLALSALAWLLVVPVRSAAFAKGLAAAAAAGLAAAACMRLGRPGLSPAEEAELERVRAGIAEAKARLEARPPPAAS